MGAAVLKREREQVTAAFDAVEQIEDVAADLKGQRKSMLRAAVKSLVGQIQPVRGSIAAELLEISVPTVRKWARAGMLREVKAPHSTVLHVDAAHLHEVLHLVRDLRAQGKQNVEFFNHLWWALQDRELLASPELQRGLAELERGEVVEL